MPSYQSLPNLEGYQSKAAKRIARLVEEHAEKTRELGAIGRDLQQVRYGIEEARNKDTEARALAARRGDKDPGRVNEEKARQSLADLEDRYRVHERVVADVEADLSRTIVETKVELLEEAREKRAAAGELFTERKRAMREAHDAQRHHAGVARWALSGAGHFSLPPPDVHVLSVPDVLDEDDPEPDHESNQHQHQHQSAENEGTVRLVG